MTRDRLQRNHEGMWLARFLMPIVAVVLLGASGMPLFAGPADPGFDITQKCRKNIKAVNEAIKAYLADGKTGIPSWDTLENIQTMLLSTKYLKDTPVGPTPDCTYFLVFQGPEIFDSYCDVHGLLDGDQSITFRYREFQFSAKVNSRYFNVAKYKSHHERLMSRVGYSPTLMENIKFHYRKNPFTTGVFVVVGVLFVWFIYRNVFGP
jgi:hypothetical protein